MSTRIRIKCSECDGSGRWTIAYSLDPYGKQYDCEQCDGTGFEEPDHNLAEEAA